MPQASGAAKHAAELDRQAKLDADLSADDHDAIRAAIEAAGGLSALVAQSPLTTALVREQVAADLSNGFDADKFCWTCGVWALPDEVMLGHTVPMLWTAV